MSDSENGSVLSNSDFPFLGFWLVDPILSALFMVLKKGMLIKGEKSARVGNADIQHLSSHSFTNWKALRENYSTQKMNMLFLDSSNYSI